jgi:hypothetical protein
MQSASEPLLALTVGSVFMVYLSSSLTISARALIHLAPPTISRLSRTAVRTPLIVFNFNGFCFVAHGFLSFRNPRHSHITATTPIANTT